MIPRLHPASTSVLLCLLCVHATAADWPQWRGPNRDGISSEAGLLESWPARGPELILTVAGIGKGHSSPMVARGRVFISGHVDGKPQVLCFDLNGRTLWAAENGDSASGRYGAQGSVTVDGDLACALSEGGRLVALDVASGREKWHRSMPALGGRLPRYKHAESLLVTDGKVICQAGGQNASVVALDRATGEVVWKSRGMSDTAAYCSPVVAELAGRTQVVIVTQIGLVGVDLRSGTLLWRYDAPFNGGRNCITPVVWNDLVFAESGRKGRAAIMSVRRDGSGFDATPVWEVDKVPASHLSGSVGISGRIYGCNGSGWGCRDFRTGSDLHRTREIRSGSTIHADGHFYVQTVKGEVLLVRADEKSSRIVSRFAIPDATKSWASPAIADGRLYIRCGDKLHVYKIR